MSIHIRWFLLCCICLVMGSFSQVACEASPPTDAPLQEVPSTERIAQELTPTDVARCHRLGSSTHFVQYSLVTLAKANKMWTGARSSVF